MSTYLCGAIDCVFLLCHISVQSESTLCNCLNVKERFYRNRVYLHSNHVCDNNNTQSVAPDRLVLATLIKYLPIFAKWLSDRLQTNIKQ